MRVVITGAGMVGAHVARELLSAGDEVTLLDVAPRDDYIAAIAGPGARVARTDVAELPGLLEAVLAARPDVVVHTAALIGEAAQVVPYRGVTVNVMGTVNVAEVVRLLGIGRLVHASTLGVNDLSQAQTKPIDEDFPRGTSGRIYGASKVACEVLLDAYANAYGFELAMLRFAGIYGRGHFAGGSGVGREVYELLAAAVHGRPAIVGAGIPPSYEMVHVKDVARGVAAAVHAEGLPYRVYNLGTGTLVTPTDVADAVRAVVPKAVVELGPTRPDRHPRLQPLDLRRSREVLDYEPRFSLVDGFSDLATELAAG